MTVREQPVEQRGRTSRGPVPPVTVALDAGAADWTLRRQLRRIADRLGTPTLDPVLAITRAFALGKDSGLAAVREAVGVAIPDQPWLAYTVDGFAEGPRGTVGLALRPSHTLAAVAGAIESALADLAVPAPLPDERFLVPAARGLADARRRGALQSLGLSGPPWYRRILPLPGSTVPPPPPPPLRPLDSTRIVLLVGGRPAAAYDLATRRWLGRAGLGDRSARAASLRAYRRARGFELAARVSGQPGETWLLGDLHLGHPGIAVHAARPFPASDVAEMDRVLLSNWRTAVRPDDRALYLGDLCAGPDPGPYRAAAGALTGRVTFVRGNHDPDLPGLARSVEFEAGAHRFLALHDPADIPPDFDGWVVHGHLHDSDLRRYPFFDPVARRINVSAETAGYAPVPLSLLCELIATGSGRVLVREIRPAPPVSRPTGTPA